MRATKIIKNMSMGIWWLCSQEPPKSYHVLRTLRCPSESIRPMDVRFCFVVLSTTTQSATRLEQNTAFGWMMMGIPTVGWMMDIPAVGWTMDIPAVGWTGVLAMGYGVWRWGMGYGDGVWDMAMGYGLMLCGLPLFIPLASSPLTSNLSPAAGSVLTQMP